MAFSPDVGPLQRLSGSALAGARWDAFDLSAASASVAEARKRVRARLREWHIDDQSCDNAQLVVSELFTNAVLHTHSETIGCELRMTGARLRVEVTDQGHGLSPCPYMPRAECHEGESGRGLLLVSALSEEWGIRPNANGTGHAVWAELGYAWAF